MLVYAGDWADSKTSVYHKIKITKPSILTVTGCRVSGNGRYGLTVKLCDSKKRLLDLKSGNYVNSEKEGYVQYIVLKGTYYIKTSGAQKYVIAAGTNTKINGISISDKGGASRSASRDIVAKKVFYGAIGVGEKAGKADWYKFRVSGSSVLYFDIEAAGSSKVSFTLYGPSYPKGIRMGDLRDDSATVRTVVKNSLGIVTGNSKVKAGQYYIKVERSGGYREKRNSALYSIRWRY